MCEYWIYGCGHAIRTPCPRPKPVTTTTKSTGTGTSTSSTGSNISTTTTSSTYSSSRRGSSNTTTTSTSTDLPFISKFCNGFPTVPKETSAPCYNCILADAKLKIQLEKAEVDAKKQELRIGGMVRTIARGPDGRYVDEYGNKIIAEEEYEQEYLYDGRPGRDRAVATAANTASATFTGGRGNGNGRFAGNGYARNDYGMVNGGGPDRRNSAAGGALNAGNGGGPFREVGLSNGYGFGQLRDNYDNSKNGNGGYYHLDEQSQQRGGANGNMTSNDFSGPPPRRNTYCTPTGSYQNSFSQQHVHPDFGGASWGQHGGGGDGLGHGLDGGMYQQQDGHGRF